MQPLYFQRHQRELLGVIPHAISRRDVVAFSAGESYDSSHFLLSDTCLFPSFYILKKS